MLDGFLRVAAATPDIRVADCIYNAEQIVTQAKEAAYRQAKIVVFPELSITGYTCGDLFLQNTLLDGAKTALAYIAEQTADLDCVVVVGLPVAYKSGLYNCAAVLKDGSILGLVAKEFLPNYNEYYEVRHFTSGLSIPGGEVIRIKNKLIPFGCDMVFVCDNIPELMLAVEICEDLWVANPPSQGYALYGATVIANPSASNEIVGKADYRRLLVSSHSARLVCGYVYSDAGNGESTSDLVYSGHNLICENGILLGESRLFENGITYADLDLRKLDAERRRLSTFQADANRIYREIAFRLQVDKLDLTRFFDPFPFVPKDEGAKTRRCEDILEMQACGLKKRITHTNTEKIVVGLSGGLDSTLALLVIAKAYRELGIPAGGIQAVTMPCFGTTMRTKNNASALAECIGATLLEIPITAAVESHFASIGQDPDTLDVTYENSQARERTQVLMDLANRLGGLVVGTGDLSEMALGWSTYNGDHMSMYAVNASVPKTLVRHIVRYVADRSDIRLKDVLYDILDTPVSPELLPPEEGEISQKTESIVGPYELHDFFLYNMFRLGYPPAKIFRVACIAFAGRFEPSFILKWLKVFYRRFFSQQFKRSCQPDGPKVGSVALSPRGDLRMPSDACADLWLSELDDLLP